MPPEAVHHRSQGPAAVADHRLHLGGDLTEAAVVLRHEKQRVIAKPAAAMGLAIDPSMTLARRGRDHAAVRRGEGHVAGVVGRATSVWNIGKLVEQEGVVGRIVSSRPRESGRVDAGPAIERVDHQPAVFGEHRQPQGQRLLRRLEGSIFRKRAAGFLNLNGRLKAIERAAFDPQRAKQRYELPQLSCIAGSQHKPLGKIDRRGHRHHHRRLLAGIRGTSTGLG